MASSTDLDGFLRADDDCLEQRLIKWFSDLKPNIDIAINVRFRNANGSSFERLNPEPIAAKPHINGIGNLVSAIEQIITNRLGPSPYGTLRIQGYQKGRATSPDLDMQRTLIPSDSGGLGEPNVTLLRTLLAHERAQNIHKDHMINSQHATLGALCGQLGLSLQQTATVRTASTASSDLSGLPTMIAFGALLAFAPMIKSALGLPADAPLRDLISRMQAVAQGAFGDVMQGQQENRDAAPARDRASRRRRLTEFADAAGNQSAEPDAVDVGPPDGAEEPATGATSIHLPSDPQERARVLLELLSHEAADTEVAEAFRRTLNARPDILVQLARMRP